jgi:hypothetical protein
MVGEVSFPAVVKENRIADFWVVMAHRAVLAEARCRGTQHVYIENARLLPHPFCEVGTPEFWRAIIAVAAGEVACAARFVTTASRTARRRGFLPGDCGNSRPYGPFHFATSLSESCSDPDDSLNA